MRAKTCRRQVGVGSDEVAVLVDSAGSLCKQRARAARVGSTVVRIHSPHGPGRGSAAQSMERASGSPPPPPSSGFGAFCSAISDTISGMATTSRSRRKQDDEKKNKKRQSPVEERPPVPTPSEAMLNNLRTAFGLLDRDSDGHVTPEELQFMLRKLGIEVKDDLITDLIKDASENGTGLIDENEFMQWVTKIQALQGLDVASSGGDTEEEIRRDLVAAFKVFDRDENGYITRDELRSALEMIGEPVTDAQLNQVLALGDIDHDGRIDYEEFVKLLL